ncbi:MAG: Maf family protein [Christensenellales bacterium]
MKIILASSSPRRKQLMKEAFSDVQIVTENVEEKCDYVRPGKIVTHLAMVKMADIDLRHPDACVVSGDTIVYYKGKIYGKPGTKERAKEYLRELSGKRHGVYTGVCVSYRGERRVFYQKSTVKFKKLTDEQIDEYIDKCSPLDKAGAYGIQDKQVVESYCGSYSNIMGLPIESVVSIVSELEKKYENG